MKRSLVDAARRVAPRGRTTSEVGGYQTREVLAAAYPGRRRSKPKTMLTHTVQVNLSGSVIRVLCCRVRLDSLADEYSGDPHAVPTCPICWGRDPRRREVLG